MGEITLSRLGQLALAPRAPDTVVAIRGADVLTWERFLAEVGGAAEAFCGCRRGVLLCRDGWRFSVGLFGLLAAGAEVSLPPNDCPATLARLSAEADCVVDDSFAAPPRPWSGEIKAALRPWSGEIEAERPRLLFHTSGSTGTAKQVARSLSSLDSEIAALETLWGASVAGAPVLATVPHHHAFGLVFKLLWPLAAARPFYSRQYDVWEDVLHDMPAGAVVVSSPAHLTRTGGLVPPAPERRPRLLLSAGAPLPEAAAAEALRLFGAPVGEIYGSTETGAVAARIHDNASPAWRPLPGYRAEAGGEGTLRLHAPGTVADGVIELPDRIALAPDGSFHLLGRADRIVKIEGKRVALDEVERALAALPEIDGVRVLTLVGPSATLAAVVVPSAAGGKALAAEGAFRWGRTLRRKLADRLEPAALPRRWRFVTELPAAAMGKHRIADFAALFEGKQG
ncbi:MAG: AMP-binding protein [Bacteroidota bacterium]